MVNPDYRYTSEDVTHFDEVQIVTIGITEVFRKMTIEYNLSLRSMIPGESRCPTDPRSKLQNINILLPSAYGISVHSMNMPFYNDRVWTDILKIQSSTPFSEAHIPPRTCSNFERLNSKFDE